jgi:hypothetical protein
MADKKAKNGAGGTPEKETPEKESFAGKKGKQLFTRLIVQGFNKIKRTLAKMFVEHVLNPEQRQWIIDRENQLDTVNTFLATVTPSHGLWELTDDFQQDFVREVIERCKDWAQHAASTPTTIIPATPTAPAFDETKQLTRLMLALMRVADQKKRDAFHLWFKGLSSNEQSRFLRFVAQVTDAELNDLIGYQPGELGALLSLIPASQTPPQQPAQLTPIQLEAAVRKDTVLSQKVADFLTRNASVQIVNFWTAVGKKKINSLEAFTDLVTLDDDLVIRHLGLDKPSVAQQLSKLAQGPKNIGTGIGDELAARQPSANSFLAKLKAKADKMEQNLINKPKKTPGTGGGTP